MRAGLLALGAFAAIAATAAGEPIPPPPPPDPSRHQTSTNPHAPAGVATPVAAVEDRNTHAKARVPKSIADDEASKVDSLPSFHDAIRDLARDDRGFLHVGDDGVVRSYAYNGSVVSHAPLHNYQIFQSFADAGFNKTIRAQLDKIFASVSGHDVTDENQLRNPPAHLKPRELQTEEALAKWQAEVDETADTMSPNKLNAALRRLQRRQSWTWDPDMPWCYGQTCTRTDSCQKLGCRVCTSWDQSTKKMCLGIDSGTGPTTPAPPGMGHIWGSCSSFPYCKKAYRLLA